jgi:hypothetical protein
MKPKEITKKEFFKALSEWKRGYMKKNRSWQKIWLWWEMDKANPNEQWFMNVAKSTKTGMEKPSWVIAKDIENWINALEKQGYKYHIDE